MPAFALLMTAAPLAGQSRWKVPDNFKALTSYVTAPVFSEIKGEPGLPRVLIIGDSISMYYTPEVRRLLSGKANVHRVPDNGKSTLYGLKNLEDWLGDGHWAVVHFNFGLHDIVIMPNGRQQVPIEDYEKNLNLLLHTLTRRDPRFSRLRQEKPEDSSPRDSTGKKTPEGVA